MLSESAAAHYWPGEDPIGKQIEMAGSPPRTMTVVGIVPDTRYRDLRTPKPGLYFPLAQSFFPYAPMVLVVRSTLSQRALASSLTSAIDRAAPGVTMSSVKPFSEYMDGAVAQPRFNAFLLTVFAVAAALLAATGLLGVMAAMVRARRREFGVRIAIGATSGEIRGLVMRRAALLAAAGLVIGIVVSLVANRVLVSLLYEVSPTDPTALLAAAGLLVVFAFAAAALPARAGSRIQPIVALRDD
jgi:ABC-type antimicrobial peptide transport system permease subunit